MKRVLILSLGALALIGCSTTEKIGSTPNRDRPVEEADVGTSEEESAAPADEPLDPTDTGEENYLLALETFDPAWYRGTNDDDLLVELGESVCLALDSGVSPDSILATGLDSDVPADTIGYVMGAAGIFLCPEHLEVLSEWADL
jgi:hypothetical protein